MPGFRPCSSSAWGLRALLLAAALALPLVGRAEPPGEAVEPAPLFNPLVVNPGPFAGLGIGTAAAPGTGPWGAVSILYAGAHPGLGVWTLQGPLSTRYGRTQLGGVTLYLNGLAGPVAGPFASLATLQVGDRLDCWKLIDTDVVRPFPKAFLQRGWISDGHEGISVGTPEAWAYAQVLILAHYTSAQAFVRAARPDLTFSHLFEEPARHRGQVVVLEGRLRRIRRFDPPPEALARGVQDLYEAFVFTPGANPFVAVFSAEPRGLPPGALRSPKIDPAPEVRFAGYFFRKFRYSADRDGRIIDAPLVIGHTLRVLRGGARVEDTAPAQNDAENLLPIFLGVLAGTVALVIGLAFWFRRNDSRVRKRLLARRELNFVPPPPDALPVAQPAARPRDDNGHANRLPPRPGGDWPPPPEEWGAAGREK